MPRLLRGTASRLAGILPAQVTGGSGIDHDSLANFAANEHYTQANITATGTVASGTWEGTTVAANKGGSGQTSYTVGDILYASGSTALAKLAASTDGHVLTATGAGSAPAWEAAGGGGTWVQLDTVTASDSSAINLDPGSSHGYQKLMVMCEGLHAATDDKQLYLRIGTTADTPDTASGRYSYQTGYISAAASNNTYGSTNSSSNTLIRLSESMGNATGENWDGVIWISDVSSSPKNITYVGAHEYHDGTLYSITGAAKYTQTGEIRNVHFVMQSGNIYGTATIFGLNVT